MMARRNLASRAFYALAYIATATWALNLPRLALPTLPLALNAALPAVTTAPSPADVELRFQRRADDLQCASSCVSVAVTKSTNCRLDDKSCRCQVENARKVLFGAQVCIVAACGYAEYAGECDSPLPKDGKRALTRLKAAVTRFQGYCLTGGGGGITGLTAELPTQGTIVVTNTAGNGAPAVSTITIGPVATTSATPASETPAASSSQSSGSSGSLSSGAIAGIAVGAAGGAILLCAALFLIYRRRGRDAGKKTEDVAAAAAKTATSPPPPPGVAAVPFKQELDSQESKPGLYTGATSPASTTVSPYTPGGLGLAPSPVAMAGQTISPSSSPPPPPVYPGSWQQSSSPPVQQPQTIHAAGAAAQHMHEVPGGREVPNPNAHEVHGASAAMEMTGDTSLPQEMPGRGHAVYEMPSTMDTR